MNWRAITRPLGYLLALFAVCIALPIPFAIAERGLPTLGAFAGSSLLTAALAAVLLLVTRSSGSSAAQTPKRREALLIVALCWLAGSACLALPFQLSGSFASFVDAWFEASSGITTTGATILANVEALPRSILFWRALLAWLGGVGFVLMVAALLPALGVGAKYLLNYEVTSAREGHLRPRVVTTARWLIAIYCALSLACFLLYLLGGMGWFDALCHALATLSTGGFSTQGASFTGFGTYFQLIAMLFMFLAALDFSLYYRLLQRDFRVWRDPQLRLFALLIGSATLLVFLLLLAQGGHAPLLALRDAAFGCISLGSSAGFAGADYAQWPLLAQGVLLLLFTLGGCAGSTSGGLKMIRVIIVLRWLERQIRHSFAPGQVVAVRVGGLAVDAETEDEVAGFVLLFSGWWLAGSLVLLACGSDLTTAFTGALACISNAGPGFGMVGPLDSYAHMPPVAKATLALLMLSGRLELLAFTALLTPGFWRR